MRDFGEERLKRMIQRAEEKLKDLKEREEHLSKYGYWDMGYFKGRISVLEEWLDEISK